MYAKDIHMSPKQEIHCRHHPKNQEIFEISHLLSTNVLFIPLYFDTFSYVVF